MQNFRKIANLRCREICEPRNRKIDVSRKFPVIKYAICTQLVRENNSIFCKRQIKPYLRNRKHVPCFYRVIQTRVEVWENEKCCGDTSRRRVFPQLFRVLPNFHECLYNSIETRSTCLLFLLENNATRKRKTTC